MVIFSKLRTISRYYKYIFYIKYTMILFFYITMPFYSLTKKYMVNVNDKVYETMFKVEEALPDKYVFEQIKIHTEYSNYFL